MPKRTQYSTITCETLPTNLDESEDAYPNLNGKWKVDSELSQSMDALLAKQGVSWFKRRMAGGAAGSIMHDISVTESHVTICSTNTFVRFSCTLPLDGSTEVSKFNSPVYGSLELKMLAYWSADRKTLLTVTTTSNWKTIERRYLDRLEGGKGDEVVILEVELHKPGTSDSMQVKRVFRKLQT